MAETYYDILGVKPDASLGEIKKAFRLLVKVHHPDKCSDATAAESKTKYLQIQQAFETLSDSRARQDYDNLLHSIERDRKEGDEAGDKSRVLDRTQAADAAVRSLFADTFFGNGDTKRREGRRQSGCNGLGRSDLVGDRKERAEQEEGVHQPDTSESTELFQRLNINNEPLSHSDGFERWLRSRPAASLTVVNDETILLSQGATVTTKDEVTQHPYTWPVTAVVRKAHDGRTRREAQRDIKASKENGPDVSEASGNRRASVHARRGMHVSWSDEADEAEGKLSEDPLALTKVALKKELHWGDVLVRILHAPVLPYDCVLLREGLDVLAAAADPTLGKDENSSFLTKPATSFNTPVVPTEPGDEDSVFLGTTCVAEVIEVGRGVKELSKGDIVLPLAASDGCWRAAAVWQERRLMALQKGLLPKLEHAAVAKQLFLAYHLLQEYARDLRPGDGVLLYGSGCLVSQLLIQFCRLLGLRSFFVQRGRCQDDAALLKTKDYLKSLGASEVFQEEQDVSLQLTRARQSLPLLAIELNHGRQICRTIQWLATGGRVVLAYEAEACTFPADLGTPSLPILLSRGVQVESFYLNGWLESRRNQQKMIRALECIGALLRADKLIVNLAEVHEISELTVKAALVSVRRPWSGATLHQQPLLTFASLEAEKLAHEERQKANILREQEARQVQETLFLQRDRVPAALRPDQVGDEATIRLTAREQCVDSYLELPPTDDHSGARAPVCFFVPGRGETVEELHILFKRYKHNLRETFQNAAFLFPPAPFESPENCADVPSWAGQHVQTLFAPIDGRKQFEGHLNGTSKGSVKICSGEIEALKDLEAGCEHLADLIEERVGVSGEKASSVVLCGVGEGGLVALLTALTKIQFCVEAVICIGMPLLAAHILAFLLAKTNKEAQKAKLFFLCGSTDSGCPAWCQEAWRKLFSDAEYCATKEAILEGGRETDERTLAHLAAVFSILRLA